MRFSESLSGKSVCLTVPELCQNVAQWIQRRMPTGMQARQYWPPKPRVVGSIPASRTKACRTILADSALPVLCKLPPALPGTIGYVNRLRPLACSRFHRPARSPLCFIPVRVLAQRRSRSFSFVCRGRHAPCPMYPGPRWIIVGHMAALAKNTTELGPSDLNAILLAAIVSQKAALPSQAVLRLLEEPFDRCGARTPAWDTPLPYYLISAPADTTP
jgi:hypothetical protein